MLATHYLDHFKLFFYPCKYVTDSKAINNKVSQEMFESIVREVVEEIGVPSASLIELENMASKMPACHEGGFALYKMMVEAVKNV
ncbi:hypothetical protein ACFX2I_006383 [Malus domestica]